MRLPLLLILPMILAACSAVTALNDASEPLEVYELRTPALQPAAARRGVEIVVEEPSASGALSVERIMIRPSPLQAQYLPGVRWSDTAPVMLQTLMVRGLLESGGFGSVGRRPVGSLGDYAILTELTDFQAETAEGQSGAQIRVRMILRIVRERDARVVATRTFSESEPA
jgi:cholesterol transport system auxiliary component